MGEAGAERVFLAIEVNDAVRTTLSGVIEQLRTPKPRVTWTRPENFHLTLRYLGDISQGKVATISSDLAELVSGFSTFGLRVQSLGAFPSLNEPSVVWSGIHGDVERLTKLQAEVEDVCRAQGIEADEHAFHPHVTLGRVRESRGVESLVRKMRAIGDVDAGEVSVSGVTLFSSTLSFSGARYRVLERFALDLS